MRHGSLGDFYWKQGWFENDGKILGSDFEQSNSIDEYFK